MIVTQQYDIYVLTGEFPHNKTVLRVLELRRMLTIYHNFKYLNIQLSSNKPSWEKM